MIFDMYEYYSMLQDKNINMIYSGPIWADGVEGIGATLKKRLSIDELPLSATQSVFSVFVEQVNNILMYSAEKVSFNEKDISKGLFILGASDKTYFIQTGNIIKNHKIELLKSRIEHLNSLDKTELRKFYKEQIKQEDTNKESLGGGIGLIEVARRASSKIEYKLRPLEEGYSFFTMHVTIG